MKEKFIEIIKSKRKRNIMLIAIFLIALIIGNVIFLSYAYYVKENSDLIYSGTVSIDNSDIAVKIYAQSVDASGNAIEGAYEEVAQAPVDNYIYNSVKSSCSEGLDIDSVVGGEIYVTASKKGACKVYFDYVKTTSDLEVYMYAQSLDADGTPIANSYALVDTIPASGYLYNSSRTTCTSGLAVTGIVNNNVEVSASNPGRCDVYFDYQTEVGDIITRIYVQNKDASGVGIPGSYTLSETAPTGYKYNSNISNCTKGLVIDKVENTEITISASNMGSCDVYFDVN